MMRRLLVACLLALACSPGSAEVGRADPAPVAGERTMYLTDSFNGSGLLPIDPVSLKDTSPRPLLPIGWTSNNSFFTVASLDGGTIAVTSYRGGSPTGQDIEISVYDARTSALRASFHPETQVIVGGLSADGSRIYARSWPPREVGSERVILDAMTGKVVDREPPIVLSRDVVTYVQDEDGRRLYVMLVPSDPNATGPRPVEIGAWDLRGGTELWRLPLPAVLAGRWRTGRSSDGLPIFGAAAPGFALSSDGRQLAVVQQPVAGVSLSTGTLSLIDAVSGGLTSERTFELTPSTIERLLSGSVALAKSPDEGVRISAAFSPDGRLVHAWGTRTQARDRAVATEQYIGMVSIRSADARVMGTDIKMERGWYDDRVVWVRAAPDGRWLYLFLERTGEFADPKGYVLRRVDPVSLRVLTERRFDGYRQPFFLTRR